MLVFSKFWIRSEYEAATVSRESSTPQGIGLSTSQKFLTICLVQRSGLF